jgi:hypothetical protein
MLNARLRMERGLLDTLLEDIDNKLSEYDTTEDAEL